MVQESDLKVHYFYLSHLTGTKKRHGFQGQLEFGMKRGKYPFLPPSRSVGLNHALNKTTEFLQGETTNGGANNIFAFDQNGFYNKTEMLPGENHWKNKFWPKKWLHVMKVHFQMHQGQLGTQNPLKMKANWDHNSHLCLQNLLLKERRALLGSAGNPVTFLLKPPQALQNTAETWAVDLAAAFRRAQSGKQLLRHRPPPPTSQGGGAEPWKEEGWAKAG